MTPPGLSTIDWDSARLACPKLICLKDRCFSRRRKPACGKSYGLSSARTLGGQRRRDAGYSKEFTSRRIFFPVKPPGPCLRILERLWGQAERTQFWLHKTNTWPTSPKRLKDAVFSAWSQDIKLLRGPMPAPSRVILEGESGAVL